MSTVYFMRHATPVSESDWQGSDETRPLSEQGKKQATKLAIPSVAKIFVSPAKRAQETAILAGIENFETFSPLWERMDDWLLSEMKKVAESVEGNVLFIGHQGSFAQVLKTEPGGVVVVKF